MTGAPIWTCRQLACFTLPTPCTKARQVAATLLLQAIAPAIAVCRTGALTAVHTRKPRGTCAAHGRKITRSLGCSARAPAKAGTLLAKLAREALFAHASTVFAKAVAITVMCTFGSRSHSLVTECSWVESQGVGEPRVTVRAVAILLVVERNIVFI